MKRCPEMADRGFRPRQEPRNTSRIPSVSGLAWGLRAGRLAWCAVVMLSCMACASQTVAAQSDVDAPADSRSEAFKSVTGPTTEDIAGGPLMLASYAIIWLVMLGYVLRVARLQARTLTQLEELTAELARARDPAK